MSHKFNDDEYEEFNKKQSHILDDNHFDEDELDLQDEQVTEEISDNIIDTICEVNKDLLEYVVSRAIPLCQYLSANNLYDFVSE